MNAHDLLRDVAELSYEHADRYADRVPVDLADSDPHDGERSDYNEHHHVVSAPPSIDDVLNRALVAKIEAFKRANGLTRGSQ